MPNVDLVAVVKIVLILIVIAIAVGAAYTFLAASFGGVPYAFTQAMTNEHKWVTQNETTGGEWVAMVFEAVPTLRPMLTVMSSVVALVVAWLAFLWLVRAMGGQ